MRPYWILIGVMSISIFCPMTNYVFFLCQVCFMLSINQIIVSNHSFCEILAFLSHNMLCYLLSHIDNETKILVKALKSLIWLDIFASHFPSLLERTPIYCSFFIKVMSQFSPFSICLFYFHNVVLLATKQTLEKNPKPPSPKTPTQTFLFLPAIKLLHCMGRKADIKVLHGWNNVFVHFTFIRIEKLQRKCMGFLFYCSLFNLVSTFLIINSTSLL